MGSQFSLKKIQTYSVKWLCKKVLKTVSIHCRFIHVCILHQQNHFALEDLFFHVLFLKYNKHTFLDLVLYYGTYNILDLHLMLVTLSSDSRMFYWTQGPVKIPIFCTFFQKQLSYSTCISEVFSTCRLSLSSSSCLVPLSSVVTNEVPKQKTDTELKNHEVALLMC